MKYTKPPLSYQQQAELLISRGLVVADQSLLVRRLEAVGYYRLCAYWHPFKRADSSFAPGTSFDEVWNRYRFDRQLRLAIMDAIERIEVAVRSALITDLAMRYGAFAHVNPNAFPFAAQRHARFVEELREEVRRSSEAFVEHAKATYDEFPDLPIWAAAETMTFGAMFTLYKMSDRRIRGSVARRYNLAEPVLFSWLQTLNYVRNICAHHARLWNRELALKPTVPDQKNGPYWHAPNKVGNNRPFVVLTLLHYMLCQIAPQTGWRDRLYALFDRFPTVPLTPMGMNDHWRDHELWNPVVCLPAPRPGLLPLPIPKP